MTALPLASSTSSARASAEPFADKSRPASPRPNAGPLTSSAPSKSGWGPFRLFPARSPSPPPSPDFGTNLVWDGEQMVQPPAHVCSPAAAPAPSVSPTPSGRFKLPSLGRSRSEVDLRSSKERDKVRDKDKDKDAGKADGSKRSRGAKSSASSSSSRRTEAPPVPALPRDFAPGHPTNFVQLVPLADALPALRPTVSTSPLAPSPIEIGTPTPTPMQAEFPRPLLRERATTSQLPRRGHVTHSASSSLSSGPPGSLASYGSYGSFSSYGSYGSLAGGSSARHPRSPESARSRPSTAQSAANVSPNAPRSYPVTPPGVVDSGASMRSGLSSAYFGSHGVGRSWQAAHVVALQAGWLQDDMLRDLGLGQMPIGGKQGRRQRDLLLGALVNGALDILERALELTPQAVAALRERRDHLYATRSDVCCDEATTACQLAQYAILHKVSLRTADDGSRFRYRSDRGERPARERHENDVARFLCDALELPEMFDWLQQPPVTEAREQLGRSTSALPPAEAERLLRSLLLSPAQQARLKTHLERAKQANLSNSPQGSLDSSTTAERDERISP